MTKAEYLSFLTDPSKFNGYSPLLKALWHIKNNGWDKAHDIVAGQDSDLAAWIHALLHRIEGDDWNARYWYNRANKNFSQVTFEEEWEEILNAVI